MLLNSIFLTHYQIQNCLLFIFGLQKDLVRWPHFEVIVLVALFIGQTKYIYRIKSDCGLDVGGVRHFVYDDAGSVARRADGKADDVLGRILRRLFRLIIVAEIKRLEKKRLPTI